MPDSNPINQEQNSNPQGQPATQQPVATDPNSLFANQLAEIKAPDGRQKYADVQTALASVPHAQNKINELSEELQRVKEELAQKKGMEAVLEQLKSQQTVTASPSVNGIDETMLASVLDRKLAEKEAVSRARANEAKVLTSLSSKFGDKAESVFNSKAEALGVSVGFLSDLARKAPDAVLEYFKIGPTADVNSTTGSVNTNVLNNTQPPKDDSYMRIFRSQDNDIVKKWKAASQS